MDVRDNLEKVRAAIAAAAVEADRKPDSVRLVAVSKTKPAEDIRLVIEAGQRIFGENRVQEAQSKWPGLKAETPDLELHLIGPLQSNKTADAVALFDVIQTVDREKIAREIAREIEKQGKSPRLYVQVNTGSEPQKAGIEPDQADAFLALCRTELGLTITGLMCIPPVDENPGPHFALLSKIARENGIETLSMGMSDDFETAIGFGATEVRIGSAIFGARSST
ncbi:MAG: YggS family pyridoxal phosphate-dependent enzyme [Hoeflea sp.]|uniref:YggS family pyridoxal phosphate-dependent enzyme n=1 Tax=Hoeflea sp. TaxID=1940281 RepID=UPI001D386C19|nr:YggS family pyridoxal phosphate-dependent enzyme [Hoeflea sp.]MBU4531793.1 YggS family pyridoxal phosphate-dependent enzyme [Alphaproteobacteria bacterium]MBU4544649.1 YggS family pyridoxal phosphate-dependent enzyme [Alphaproteobacteria bacterium]MBU4552880.1 YggS family pyridoxal phosphate-dependent enzyme [Alphaproteobacteria bacterium]MBV1725069.1 YggS family pyridoxal phosphate-dependent enzyme [Hoeflea sp.]MBV1761089.1 YggS family pyridoxal phosphate-dependent enzyme [Hoeflea sp.]